MSVDISKLQALAGRGRGLLVPMPENRSPDWYRITNADTDTAEVFIYGVIGSDWDEGDVTAASFVKDLRNITASAIDLRLNSPGGFVFDGFTIYTALVEHAAKVNVYVDGVAASAASFVAMAGDEVVMSKPSKMFIHDAQGVTLGGPKEHQASTDLLNELSDTIAGLYADRAGGSVADFRTAMDNETWYSATQAVEAGLADRVAEGNKASAPEDRRSQMIRARAHVHLRG